MAKYMEITKQEYDTLKKDANAILATTKVNNVDKYAKAVITVEEYIDSLTAKEKDDFLVAGAKIALQAKMRRWLGDKQKIEKEEMTDKLISAIKEDKAILALLKKKGIEVEKILS